MKTKKVPMAVQIAQDVLDMQDELESLRDEVEYLRDYQRKYNDLLNGSIAHSQHMMCGILELATKPGVMDAIGTANERHNAESNGGASHPTRTPGYRAGTNEGDK